MRTVTLRDNRRVLARSAAILLVGGLAAGCSSGVSRFTSDIVTGSTANQRSIIKPQSQPFPGDVRPRADTGVQQPSVARAAVEPAPVTRSTLPPAAAPQPVAAAPRLDATPTGSVEKPKPVQAAALPESRSHKGWSRAGGTQVTLRDGETLYNLSKRFGVPVTAIMDVNGIDDADSVKAGQSVVIPTYVYSSSAGVSAPDATRKVADSKSSRGLKSDVPAGDLPRPAPRPTDKVAVLPQQPKVKEQTVQTAPADAAPSQGKKPQGGVYTVVAGDTLGGIAARTGSRVAAIQQANGLKGSDIRIGQTLRIPSGPATLASAAPARLDPVVTGTAGPSAKSDRPKVKADKGLAPYTPPKRKADKVIDDVTASVKDEAPDSTGIGKMRWPVRGRVVGTYGNNNNDGIDIAVPEGTPVKAAENGVVIFAGDGLKDFGRTVLVRHADGKVTVYGHTSELKVQRGDTVRRGQEIARSGMSGNADTPKLHFEVRENSDPVDPQQFLE